MEVLYTEHDPSLTWGGPSVYIRGMLSVKHVNSYVTLPKAMPEVSDFSSLQLSNLYING